MTTAVIQNCWDEEFIAMLPRFEGKDGKANRLYAAKNSFRFFIYLYMSHYITLPPAQFQKDSWDAALEKRVLELWPRSYGKSVAWSVCYPLWKLLCNPENFGLKWEFPDVFLISHSASLAEKWVRKQQKELLANPRIIEDFNPQPSSKLWRGDEYEVIGMGHVKAIGKDTQFRGEHPTDAILDDVEDRQEAGSETNRDKLRDWFYGDFLGAMRLEKNKEAGIKIIGNLVHPLGLYNELLSKDWWRTTVHAVYKPDGVTPLWPEYMDAEAIEDLRSKIPESIFMAEYMNQPVISENPVFNRKTFHKYEPGFIYSPKGNKLAIKDMILVSSLDPAISVKDGADYSALTQWGLAMDGDDIRIYCLEAKRGHWSSPTQITEMLIFYEKYPGTIQLIETVSGFKAIYQEYKDRLERERLNVKVIDIIPVKDKGMRANATTHLFEKGYVHFNHDDKMQNILMDELAMFDYTKRKHGRDDFVDATTQALNYLDTIITRRQNKNKRSKKPIIMHNYTNPIYGAN